MRERAVEDDKNGLAKNLSLLLHSRRSSSSIKGIESKLIDHWNHFKETQSA
ncbi:hypothetical protein COLO4_32041 [Corchorus olitorius]|uniref:Uncharacterized protein n=1 Tax=Corchorus olitorius TaxID=93759 RepID=A0A1R3H2D1_9ROSI|nr:hypothetical protein COLO4_32041 [Corchorus olitorius]